MQLQTSLMQIKASYLKALCPGENKPKLLTDMSLYSDLPPSLPDTTRTPKLPSDKPQKLSKPTSYTGTIIQLDRYNGSCVILDQELEQSMFCELKEMAVIDIMRISVKDYVKYDIKNGSLAVIPLPSPEASSMTETPQLTPGASSSTISEPENMLREGVFGVTTQPSASSLQDWPQQQMPQVTTLRVQQPEQRYVARVTRFNGNFGRVDGLYFNVGDNRLAHTDQDRNELLAKLKDGLQVSYKTVKDLNESRRNGFLVEKASELKLV